MENTDAKVYSMIDDLSRETLVELLLTYPVTEESHSRLIDIVRERYESGDIPSEEIVAAWNDNTWNDR